MTTLAEGVETEAQLAQLRSGHCGEAQGYLFSPPRPANEVAAMCLRLSQTALAAETA
jgi:EAL domain-containing protein (putative c-di-GMP-specific phosphodiesterase class I)